MGWRGGNHTYKLIEEITESKNIFNLKNNLHIIKQMKARIKQREKVKPRKNT